MHTHADKTKGATTDTDPKMQRNSEPTFHFADNRPETIAQTKLQEMVDNSLQVMQLQALQEMANNSLQVRQSKAFHERVGNDPQVPKALRISAMFNGRPASAPGQSQSNSSTLQGHSRTPNPHGPAQLKQPGSLSNETVQLKGGMEEEELHMKKGFPSLPTQFQMDSTPPQNNAGLPDNLKSGIESLSGMAMDKVKVHYRSSLPARLNALAYTQGTDIHVAPGQEQHLPHEAWHVVQQAQGRVQPTIQMKDGLAVNDDKGLEHEADVMGMKSLQNQFSDRTMEGSTRDRKASIFSHSPAPYVRGASITHGFARGAPIQGMFIKGKAPQKVEDIERTIKTLKSSGNIGTIGTIKETTRQKFLRKLAEGPNITYASDEELIKILNTMGGLHFTDIMADKSNAQWRKLNRIAGQMEARLASLKAPEGLEKMTLLASEMTGKLNKLVMENKYAMGIEVLQESIVILEETRNFLQTKGSRFMWQFYGLLSHLGPLSHAYVDFAQAAKTTTPEQALRAKEAAEKAKLQEEKILLLLREVRQLMAKNPDGATVVAHRGTGPTNRTMGGLISETDNRRINRLAENSPDAFNEAFSQATKKEEAPALDGVECDVYLSSDGVPILSHEDKVREQLKDAQKIEQEKRLTSTGKKQSEKVEVHDLPSKTLLEITRTESKGSRFMTLAELLEMATPVAANYYAVTGKAFRVEVEMKGAKVVDSKSTLTGNRPLQSAVAKIVSQFYKKAPGIPVEIVLFNGTPLDVEGYAGLRSKKTALGGLYTGLGTKKEELEKGAYPLQFIDELRYQFTVEFNRNTVDASDLVVANKYLDNFITTLVFGQEFAAPELGLQALEPSEDIKAFFGETKDVATTIEDRSKGRKDFDLKIQDALERYAEKPENMEKVKKLHILTDYPKKAAWMKEGLKKATKKALEKS